MSTFFRFVQWLISKDFNFNFNIFNFHRAESMVESANQNGSDGSASSDGSRSEQMVESGNQNGSDGSSSGDGTGTTTGG